MKYTMWKFAEKQKSKMQCRCRFLDRDIAYNLLRFLYAFVYLPR